MYKKMTISNISNDQADQAIGVKLKELSHQLHSVHQAPPASCWCALQQAIVEQQQLCSQLTSACQNFWVILYSLHAMHSSLLHKLFNHMSLQEKHGLHCLTMSLVFF